MASLAVRFLDALREARRGEVSAGIRFEERQSAVDYWKAGSESGGCSTRLAVKIQKQSHSRDTGWSMRDAEKWNSAKVQNHVRSGSTDDGPAAAREVRGYGRDMEQDRDAQAEPCESPARITPSQLRSLAAGQRRRVKNV